MRDRCQPGKQQKQRCMSIIDVSEQDRQNKVDSTVPENVPALTIPEKKENARHSSGTLPAQNLNHPAAGQCRRANAKNRNCYASYPQYKHIDAKRPGIEDMSNDGVRAGNNECRAECC